MSDAIVAERESCSHPGEQAENKPRQDGRDPATGRFLPGTCGNRLGRPRKADHHPVDMRRIRTAILKSWDRVNGDALLDRLAEQDPLNYLRLVLAVVPPDPDDLQESQGLTINKAVVLLAQIEKDGNGLDVRRLTAGIEKATEQVEGDQCLTKN
jgi:hypothetical protein